MQLSLQFYTFSFSNSLHKQLFCLVFQQILFRGSFLCSSFPQSLFIESFSSNFIKALRNSFLNTYIPSFLLIEFTNSFSDTHSGTGLVTPASDWMAASSASGTVPTSADSARTQSLLSERTGAALPRLAPGGQPPSPTQDWSLQPRTQTRRGHCHSLCWRTQDWATHPRSPKLHSSLDV